MSFLELAADRYSVRSFSDRPIEPEKMDASIVCTHMMLEAWELGIGSVWVRAFDSWLVARTFNLPRHIKPICLLPIGCPSEGSAPYAPWHNAYRPIEDMVEEL